LIDNPARRVYRRMFKPDPWRKWTAAARALPDFLVIGAMRSGTTSLHDLVCRHPQVLGAIKKEIHYFDLNFTRGEPWYRAHFPRAERLRSRRGITGEASPYYIFHPLAHRRAADLVPGARILAFLRHPIDRAYSHYWHSVQLGEEPFSFEEALRQETARLSGEERRLLADLEYVSRPHLRWSYLSRSIYADQLERWLTAFPRRQLLVLEHRAFFEDLEARSRQLFDFLGLDSQPVHLPKKLNRTAYPPMTPETRMRLLEFFAPHNARLFGLLGETFDWQD
jgi:hypothetical protein